MEQIPREKLEGVLSLFSLTGRVAVVTGGSRGLGRGMALALAAAGADVAPVSRTLSDLEVVAEEIHSLGCRALPVAADVTEEHSVARAVEAATELGPLRVAVCCAGVATAERAVGRDGPLPLERFERVIAINLTGTFTTVKLAAAAMMATESAPPGLVAR